MSFAFDPIAAADTYAAMDTEELIRIAYLEPNYVEEAKALAQSELDRRGLPADRKDLIRHVRNEIRARARALQRHNAESFERSRAVEMRIGAGALIFMLWAVALFLPIFARDWSEAPDDAAFLLLSGWVVAVAIAFRKARAGSSRQLYLVLIIPAVLFVIGMVIRWIRYAAGT